jgi:hypothetical protein
VLEVFLPTMIRRSMPPQPALNSLPFGRILAPSTTPRRQGGFGIEASRFAQPATILTSPEPGLGRDGGSVSLVPLSYGFGEYKESLKRVRDSNPRALVIVPVTDKLGLLFQSPLNRSGNTFETRD